VLAAKVHPYSDMIIRSMALLCLIMMMFSCSPTRRLAEGQYLLEKNTIQNEPSRLSKDELNAIVIQQPNRKILPFLRFHLQMFNLPTEEGLKKARVRKDLRWEKKNERRAENG
jgi:hypothetical protein